MAMALALPLAMPMALVFLINVSSLILSWLFILPPQQIELAVFIQKQSKLNSQYLVVQHVLFIYR